MKDPVIIRPVSDLRNKYNEVERDMQKHGAIYLTKNGYGSAVLIDMNEYVKLTGHTDFYDKKAEIKPRKSGRGILHYLADPEKRTIENRAGMMHAIEKYGKRKGPEAPSLLERELMEK